MNSKLMDTIAAATKSEYAAVLDTSEVFNNRDEVSTPIPALNIAFSGKIKGGFGSGITVWAGPSKHFKTMFTLISAASYLKKYDDAICVFFDNEFGSPKAYFESLGIDPQRVFHNPFETVEALQTDFVNILKKLKRNDKVFFIVDSIGMAASDKEIADAENDTGKKDMTRAQALKSLFRMITAPIRLKNLHCHVVAHTYETMEKYAKKIVSGGQGAIYAADNIYIISRSQDKDDKTKEILGYDFKINVEKSRFSKEKTVIPITVNHENGLSKWSGLFDLGLESGYIFKATTQTYNVMNKETGEVLFEKNMYRKDMEANSEVFKRLFTETDFNNWIDSEYSVSHGKLLADVEEIDSEAEATADTEQ